MSGMTLVRSTNLAEAADDNAVGRGAGGDLVADQLVDVLHRLANRRGVAYVHQVCNCNTDQD